MIGSTLHLLIGPPPPAARPSPEGTGLVTPAAASMYDLDIADFGYTGFWTGSPTPVVPVYTFTYKPHDVILNSKPLCQPTTEAGSVSFSGTALIFRGDRYDATHKTVSETGAGDTWFNIACAGTAVAKMHLLRHTFAGTDPGAPAATVGQRQAVLKMLTGDYCGTGAAFTETGHRLLYSYYQPGWDRTQPVPFQPWNALEAPPTPPPARSLDAIWGPDGAVCVDEARLESTSPNQRVNIDFECELNRHRMLKPCSPRTAEDAALLTTLWGWAPRGYVISANE